MPALRNCDCFVANDSEEGVRDSARLRPEMQMGPALLPTPLSPARGHPVPCETSGGPSASLAAAHTWRPMSNPRSPNLATGASEFRHRRSHRHPAFAPALPRSAFARRLSFPLPCAVAWPRPRSFADPVRCGLGAFAFSPAFLLDQITRPVRRNCVTPISNEPACVWPKPSSSRLSMNAWTCSAAIPGI